MPPALLVLLRALRSAASIGVHGHSCVRNRYVRRSRRRRAAHMYAGIADGEASSREELRTAHGAAMVDQRRIYSFFLFDFLGGPTPRSGSSQTAALSAILERTRETRLSAGRFKFGRRVHTEKRPVEVSKEPTILCYGGKVVNG